MKKVITLITSGLIAASTILGLTALIGAELVYSDTNKDIEIVFGEFVGYRFNGEGAPVGDIDTSKIATVKFYIKCPNLESIDVAIVSLAYNSESTDWVDSEHDLNDGLIVEIDVSDVSEDDYFEAALGTWNEEVQGTFSVELLDADGNVLGIPVYGSQTEPNQTTAAPQETSPPDTTPQITQPPATTAAPTNPVPTGSANIITATVMTALSAWAIVSMRRKKDK